MKRLSAWHASRRYGAWLTTVLTLGLSFMSGSPGAEFSAEWRITQDGDTIEHPETRGFEGDTLEGTVKLLSDDERLEVDIVKGSNRTRSSTQGKGGTLTVVVR